MAAVLCTLPVQGFALTVNTNDISDGAVTSPKIAAGAVTNAQISGTISGDKLGAHSHYASDIVGTINASNLPIGTTAGTVAAGDHTHDTTYQKKYANLIVVAKSGGDFTDPVAAINSITDASASNPYVIKIFPGIYDLNGQQMSMKSYIDIEGSGENTTRIKGNINNAALVVGADNAEIRLLTIESFGYWVPAGIACNDTSPKNLECYCDFNRFAHWKLRNTTP